VLHQTPEEQEPHITWRARTCHSIRFQFLKCVHASSLPETSFHHVVPLMRFVSYAILFSLEAFSSIVVVSCGILFFTEVATVSSNKISHL
jgi:hypothetical protein